MKDYYQLLDGIKMPVARQTFWLGAAKQIFVSSEPTEQEKKRFMTLYLFAEGILVQHAELEDYVKELTPLQQQVFDLKREGNGEEEIGKVTEQSVDQVWSTLAKAREQLARDMQKQGCKKVVDCTEIPNTKSSFSEKMWQTNKRQTKLQPSQQESELAAQRQQKLLKQKIHALLPEAAQVMSVSNLAEYYGMTERLAQVFFGEEPVPAVFSPKRAFAVLKDSGKLPPDKADEIETLLTELGRAAMPARGHRR